MQGLKKMQKASQKFNMRRFDTQAEDTSFKENYVTRLIMH
jgi:hypothetical protein